MGLTANKSHVLLSYTCPVAMCLRAQSGALLGRDVDVATLGKVSNDTTQFWAASACNARYYELSPAALGTHRRRTRARRFARS